MERITLRKTRDDELDFVLKHENAVENRQFIRQWSLEQHRAALSNPDMLHLIIEDQNQQPVGYVILIGLLNSSKDITLQRIVVTEKAKGIGRQVIREIKRMVFEDFKAHRLHLIVRDYNERARQLYVSEGFVEEGVMRECILVDGEYKSSVMMSILEQEY
jgi:diamine N-acetyltransferase